jgi:lipopolysaccharide/colanic/teichoic acid biosynthesis glycosyltransferase
MKIIITGASGRIGTALVPYLQRMGHTLLLAGRDAAALRAAFPDVAACDYSGLKNAAAGYDACINLAARNNDRPGDIAEFRAVNVALIQEIYGACADAGVSHFIHISTFHADDGAAAPDDPYAITKREADSWLLAQASVSYSPALSIIKLPAVYGQNTPGILGKAARLPGFMRTPALAILGALKPIIGVDAVCAHLHRIVTTGQTGTQYLRKPAEPNALFRAFKAMIDWGFAISIIILFFWLFILLYFVIRLTSAGPAIFAQARVGRHGKAFTCYKFRTMIIGTVQAASHEVGQSSITPVGGFLRRTKLDELPQVVNILCGQISLVGPRPCLPVQAELIEQRTQRGVFAVKPGITGWAQIHDIDMSDPARLAKWDESYIAQRGIIREIAIILRTFIGGGRGDRTAAD